MSQGAPLAQPGGERPVLLESKGHWDAENHALSGILFNHESPRRGFEFVTRKIINTIAKIKHGLATLLPLGNLDTQRDWGFAGDYVEAMWRMLQQPQPQDYVIATGETHSVREFVQLTFDRAGLDWEKYVVDQTFFRPSEVNLLLGDAGEAERELGWRPKVRLEQLVHMMVDADLALFATKGTA